MKRRWKWSLLALVLVIAAVFGAMSLTAGATDPNDRTPAATAENTVTGAFAGIAIPSATDTTIAYYLPVNKTTEADASTTAPTAGAYWELRYDADSNNWKPAKLFIRAGLTVVNGAPYELSPSVATINGVPVDAPSGETPMMGTITGGGAYGAAAVRIGDSDEYYVMTSGDGWQRADAAVHNKKDGTYYYYTDLGGASYAAAQAIEADPNAEVELMLLRDVTISAPSPAYAAGETTKQFDLGSAQTDGKLTVYCCHDSKLTLDAEGLTLALHAKLTNNNGAATADGGFCAVTAEKGEVDDYLSNAVTAKPGTTVRSYGSSQTYLWADSAADARVSVSGAFAKVSGYVDIAADTTIHGTDTPISTTTFGSTTTEYKGDAYVVSVAEGMTPDVTLTVTGGTVHTLCAFGETGKNTALNLTGGTLHINIGDAERTYLTGNGAGTAGDVIVECGTVSVNGTVNKLRLVNGTGTISTAQAELYGTADHAELVGAATLTLSADGGHDGIITTYVSGTADGTNYPTLNTNATTVRAYGEFLKVKGTVEIYENHDLTIHNVAVTDKIIGKSQTAVLTIAAADGEYHTNLLDISGTFGAIKTTGVDLELRTGVTVNQRLDIVSATVQAFRGATIGKAGKGYEAICTVKDGKLIVTGACEVYAKVEGVRSDDGSINAEYHFEPGSIGYPRIHGFFKLASGRAYTCGDVTINGTASAEGYNNKKLLLTGGCPYYDEHGDDWTLTLTDTAASATVELTNYVSSGGDAATPRFRAIEVRDTQGNANCITLTNAGYEPVQIGSDAAKAGTALSITGDGQTLVTLTTLDICGSQKGVAVTGVAGSLPKVTLTGAAGAMQPVTGTSMGVEAVYADLTMENYAITSAMGVSAASSTFSLTGSTVTATSNGMTLKDNTTATLDAVDVTSTGSGVVIENQTGVTLKNAVNVKAEQTAVSVAGGSTLQNTSGSGTFTSTGNVEGEAIALRAADSTVTLKQYTFLAQNANGQGVIVTGSSMADLSYPTGGGTGDNTICGGKNGLYVKDATVTIHNYYIYGSTDKTAATALNGNYGVQVESGELRLDGENHILGALCGLRVCGGSVTNYKTDASVWTTDEKSGTAAGTGRIEAGKAQGAVGAYITGGTVTLGGYYIATQGASGDSHGVWASGPVRVYLDCGNSDPSIFGATGDGVLVDSGALVTIDNAKIQTKGNGVTRYAAHVTNGTLNLGKGVTLATAGNAIAAVLGESADSAKLFIADANEVITAEGSFYAVTGYVTQRGDLTVKNTVNGAKYSADYTKDSLTVRGIKDDTTAANTSRDLVLGGGKIDAALTDGSFFSAVSVTGTTDQALLAVKGDLTINSALNTEATRDYGLYAKNAFVNFAEAGKAVTIAADQNSATALLAENSLIHLRGALTFTGKAGIAVMDNTTLTGFAADGGMATTAEAAKSGTATTTGTITAANGDALSVSAGSTALLGELTYEAGQAVLRTQEAKEVYLTTTRQTDPAVNLKLFGQTIADLTDTGKVTIENYIMNQNAPGTDAAIRSNATDLVITGGVLNAAAGKTGIDITGKTLTLTDSTVSVSGAAEAAVKATNADITATDTVITAANETKTGIRSEGGSIDLTRVKIGSETAKPEAGIMADGGAGKTLKLTNTEVFASERGVFFLEGDVTMTNGAIRAENGDGLYAKKGDVRVTDDAFIYAAGSSAHIVLVESGDLVMKNTTLMTDATNAALVGADVRSGDATLEAVKVGSDAAMPQTGVRANGGKLEITNTNVYASNIGVETGSGTVLVEDSTLTAAPDGTAMMTNGETTIRGERTVLIGKTGLATGVKTTLASGRIAGTEAAARVTGVLIVEDPAILEGTIVGEKDSSGNPAANVYIEKTPDESAVYSVEGNFKNLFVKMTPAKPADPNVAGSTETPAVIPTIRLTGNTTIDAMKAREADAEGNYPECELKAVADEHCNALTVKSGKLDLDASGTGVAVALTVPSTTVEGKETPDADVSAKGSLKSLSGTITPTGDLVIRGGTGTLLAVPKDKAIALEISGMSGTADISSYIREYETLRILAGDATLTQLVTAASEGNVTLGGATGKKASLVMGEGASMRVLRGGSFQLAATAGTATIETQSGRITGTTELAENTVSKLCDTGATNHQGWHEKDDAAKTIKIGNGQSYTITKDVTLVEKPLPFSGSVPATTAKITVTAGEGGTVSPGTGAYELGKDAAFNIRPNAGYRIADLIVDGQSVGAGARYTFRALSEGHTLEAVFEKTTPVEELFEDIDSDTWCREAAQLVYDSCIMNGRTETRFMPAAPLNRGMFVTMLYRLEGTPAVTSTSKFSDVTEDTWCHDAVVWGSENAIVSGYSDGTFRPTATVSRQQLVTFLWRYSKAIGLDVSVGENTNILSYSDAFDVSEYAVPAVQWACGEQILRGSGGMLYPHANTTRGHAAAFLARFMELLSAAE